MLVEFLVRRTPGVECRDRAARVLTPFEISGLGHQARSRVDIACEAAELLACSRGIDLDMEHQHFDLALKYDQEQKSAVPATPPGSRRTPRESTWLNNALPRETGWPRIGSGRLPSV
jgi:hypothetical protein